MSHAGVTHGRGGWDPRASPGRRVRPTTCGSAARSSHRGLRSAARRKTRAQQGPGLASAVSRRSGDSVPCLCRMRLIWFCGGHIHDYVDELQKQSAWLIWEMRRCFSIRKRDGRSVYDPIAKRELIDACMRPGVLVTTVVARACGMNANQLSTWIRVQQRASSPTPAPQAQLAQAPTTAFVPVMDRLAIPRAGHVRDRPARAYACTQDAAGTRSSRSGTPCRRPAPSRSLGGTPRLARAAASGQLSRDWDGPADGVPRRGVR